MQTHTEALLLSGAHWARHTHPRLHCPTPQGTVYNLQATMIWGHSQTFLNIETWILKILNICRPHILLQVNWQNHDFIFYIHKHSRHKCIIWQSQFSRPILSTYLQTTHYLMGKLHYLEQQLEFSFYNQVDVFWCWVQGFPLGFMWWFNLNFCTSSCLTNGLTGQIPISGSEKTAV